MGSGVCAYDEGVDVAVEDDFSVDMQLVVAADERVLGAAFCALRRVSGGDRDQSAQVERWEPADDVCAVREGPDSLFGVALPAAFCHTGAVASRPRDAISHGR